MRHTLLQWTSRKTIWLLTTWWFKSWIDTSVTRVTKSDEQVSGQFYFNCMSSVNWLIIMILHIYHINRSWTFMMNKWIWTLVSDWHWMTTELVAWTFAICHTILKASYPGTPTQFQCSEWTFTDVRLVFILNIFTPLSVISFLNFCNSE